MGAQAYRQRERSQVPLALGPCALAPCTLHLHPCALHPAPLNLCAPLHLCPLAPFRWLYSGAVPVHVVQHPLVQDALLTLRDASTPPDEFRRVATRISVLLAAEAMRDLPTRDRTVVTPLGPATGRAVAGDVVVVPVLRAGLGMLDAVLELIPTARVGHLGLQRDETTAVASRYYSQLPRGLERQLRADDRPDARDGRQRRRRPRAAAGAPAPATSASRASSRPRRASRSSSGTTRTCTSTHR